MSILRILGPATPFTYVGIIVPAPGEPIRLYYTVPHPLAIKYTVPGPVDLTYTVPVPVSLVYDMNGE